MIWLNFYYYFTTGPENKNENNNNKDTRDQNTPIPPEVSEPPAPPAHDQGDGHSENPSEKPSENPSEFVDEPAVRLKEATLELHLKSQPHKDAIQAEMTQR